ncbi:unnamed protein product [Scytosiphon promiscuus]
MHVPVEEENPDIRHCRVTTVPVGEVLSRLESMGWGPEHIEESRDAGRFVCNYVYYLSLGLSEKSAPRVGGGRGSGRTGSAGGDSERGEQAPEGSVAPTGCTRHSLFIHVPPFKVVPKEKQLALLVACLSAIAASLASRASPTPRRSGSGTERAPTGLGTSATADAAGPAGPAQPAAASAGAPVAPLLSLSSYEAAVLAAADPEARTVQFALEALADEGGIGVDGGEGARALDRPEDGHRGDPAPPADATRRRLVQAGFDGLDVDAAMATTGSDNTEVNMQFLLDVTPLLPHGAPAEALSLLEQHRGTPTHGHHARNGSGGGAMSAWPRVRGAISPAAMGGVSPKWIGDVSPARDDPDRANKPSSLTSSSGGGGLLSRFRRGHRRTRSTASAASDAPATERSPDKGASPPTASSRTRSSSTSSPPAAREYARRTTAHAARSHSPPPARGVGIFGAGNRSGRAVLSSGPNLRLALLVRLDLGMTTGMLAAQCSRAALAAAQKAEGSGRADTLAVWREAGESIVVLGAGNATSLDTILTIGAAHHLPITMVRDKQAAWVGNLGADNCSVAAIGPAPMSALRSVAGSLRVL